MKICVVLFIFCLVAASRQDTVREAMLKANGRACARELSLDPHLIKQTIKSGLAPNDMSTKCFFKCLLTKEQAMTPTGELNLAPVKERLLKAAEMVDVCSATLGTDSCDVAFSATQCLRGVFETLVWFERVSMIVILLNCVTLGMYQPCVDDDCNSNRCKILQVFDDFIFAFFTLEMTIKMIAMGVWGAGSYLADSWNRLDLFIVFAGAIEYCLHVENMNLSAIRTIRVLRPLRAINRIPTMADNTEDIPESLQYHPCHGPLSMMYYDGSILTDSQQTELNKMKIDAMRENEMYLAKHPQIRALVALATRSVLKHRPRSNLHHHIGRYFSKPRIEIEKAVDRYLSAREAHIYEGDSGVNLVQNDEWQWAEMEEQEKIKDVPKDVLEEILQEAFQRLGINLDDDNCDIQTLLSRTKPNGSTVQDVISEMMGKTASCDLREILQYLAKTTDAEEECAELTPKEAGGEWRAPTYVIPNNTEVSLADGVSGVEEFTSTYESELTTEEA